MLPGNGVLSADAGVSPDDASVRRSGCEFADISIVYEEWRTAGDTERGKM